MKGIVYEIKFNKNKYVGSTILKLFQRQANHNYDYSSGRLNTKLYKTARENNIDKLELILIEEIEFEDIDELRKLEEEYRIKLNANLNENACYRSDGYRDNNKEDIAKYQKEYYENNKEDLVKYHQEYCKENKEHKKAYDKEYRENNKEKIRNKLNEKFECICGGKYTYQNKLQHFKTKKHQIYLLKLL